MNNQDIEVKLFIEAIKLKYGYDFSNYAQASLKRRIIACVKELQYPSIISLLPDLLANNKLLASVISHISVPVSELFRDPKVFKYLKEEIVPQLASYPQINIWIAGCAGGQEAFSMAIMLEELNLLSRVRIYATDINDVALEQASQGIFKADDIDSLNSAYKNAGGQQHLSKYLTMVYGFAKLNSEILDKIYFSTHNITTDGVFGEFQLIMCRNVMIYFNHTLKETLMSLIHNSLERTGFVCLGLKDNQPKHFMESKFQSVSSVNAIFKKAKHNGLCHD
ncbi:MAG: protein-glutamate O-methyltransferase CheR [Colwellia sp.]|nr:protein-glutamate O-methyltransferase CheR [Colwellia sp.]